MRVLTGLLLAAAACLAQTAPRFGRGVWRGQDVEFRVLDGWAVCQGDIIIGRAAEMAARYRALLEAPDENARGKGARLHGAAGVCGARALSHPAHSGG